MIEWIWKQIAKVCAKPLVFHWLANRAMRTPYAHLGGYMRRWWLMPRWTLVEDERGILMPKPWMPFAVRVHHILREDRDPYLHDHPWDWRTIILSDWYCEEDVFGEIIPRFAGTTRSATAETFHRIDMVPGAGVWTLFITYRKRNKWGFMVGDPARKVYHRDYRSSNDRTDEGRGS